MTQHFSAPMSMADALRAALSAAWPRSAVRQEIARLHAEGHRDGESGEMAFSVGVADEAQLAAAVRAIREAGFAADGARVERGFVTVHADVPLRALDLARAVARLERAVAPYEGCVAVIGPTRAPSAEPVTDVRVVARRRMDPMASRA